ncbi:hypothetical protein J3A83DRAFT_4155198 [Scleroderma citrinum]
MCRAQGHQPSLHPHPSTSATVSSATTYLEENLVIACPPDPLPHLPPELHLHIIETIAERIPFSPNQDQLYDPIDLATLCACSLVCKLWLNTARARIWSSTRVHEMACSLARLSIPSFAARIMYLSIRETRGNPWDPKWLDNALPYLAAHLKGLHSLEIERVTWEYLSSHSRTTCLESFRRVKELVLRGCSFHTAADLCEFLAEFDKLEVLTLDGVHCMRSDAPRWYLDAWVDGKKCVSPPSNALRAVGMRGAPMDTVLEWIMSGIEYRKGIGMRGVGITSAKLGGVGIAEAEVVGRFLREVGESLSELRVGFDQSFVERGDAFTDQIDLGRNSTLRELHVFGLVVPSPDPTAEREETSLTQLTSLLSPIQSPMEVLSLAMYPADIRAFSMVDFDGMARVFEKREWAGVEEVRVVISNKGECGFGRVVKQRLSKLDERGVLRVNVGFDEREVI